MATKVTELNLSDDEADALQVVAEYFGPELAAAAAHQVKPICEWAETDFFIPENQAPIILEPVQKCFLKYAYASDATTWLYSTIKKSGKTAISGLVGRYTAENSGPKAEVYFVANDKEQAKDRAYEAAKASVELSPGYDQGKRILRGRWKVIERNCVHLGTGSKMQAIASDYEGAAGANPNMTLWTEIWGMSSERMKRLWDEMTPVPTRKRSVRYVETYAGFQGESEILWELYKTAVVNARRLTLAELEAVCGPNCWPYEDKELPFFVNEAARTFAYWDEGLVARRMPWQRGPEAEAYYREQETTLRPEAFERLHLNKWVSAVQQFLPLVWWQKCKTNARIALPSTYPCVICVDASISNDCTAIVGVSRYPEPSPQAIALLQALPGEAAEKALVALNQRHAQEIVLRFATVFNPTETGIVDYAAVKAKIKDYCSEFNVVQITYDVYQLHQMMQELTREAVAWCKQFPQASQREIADKGLYDLIRDRKVHHFDEFSSDFVENCAAYVALTQGNSGKVPKIERLRIVKKAKDRPVDPMVALSMAANECLRLNL